MITHSVTQFAVHRKDCCPLLGDSTTTVEICDEGGGKYLRITQPDIDSFIVLDFEELDKLYNIARLLWQ